MTRSSWLTGTLLAGLFLALHLPFLPPALDDVDAINFALGVRDYDVSKHQPHPPGYPLFILAAKGLHGVGLSEVHALSLLSAVGGALGIFGCVALFRALDRERPPIFTWLAVVLVLTCPLYWITAARPLTDTVGLAAALPLQAAIITAPSVAALAVVSVLAGVAVGLRSQVVWLTGPVLLFAVFRLPRKEWWRGLIQVAIGYGIGGLFWGVPLLVEQGPVSYLRTFWHQGVEDIGGVAMLATTHTIALLVLTLREQLIAPWGYWQVAALVLMLATVGAGVLLFRSRSVLAILVVAFGPYLIFDLLFEEAITTRYALPLIVPAAYLAVRGASLFHKNVAVLATLAIAAAAIVVDDATIYGYAGMPAPAFRMLGDMRQTTTDSQKRPPVWATHRNQSFSMRRPLQWAGDQAPTFSAQLPAPPKHEWLEVVNYWNGGGRAPIWFIADPLRSDIALIRTRQRPTLYRWPFRFKELVGGARPDELDWYVLESPDWYLGEGWALTPETAGVAAAEHHGAGYGGIRGWIRRSQEPITLMVGGRNLASSGAPASVRIAVDGQQVADLSVPSGFFLKMWTVPVQATGGEYAEVTISSDSPQLAIEQFDAQSQGRAVYGFGEGWNEQEYNPATGALWRWTTDQSNILVRPGGHALALALRGEIEAAKTSHVVVRVGPTVAAAFDVDQTFTKTILIPSAALSGPEQLITIESSAWYVPAEKRWRSLDRRRLGLKLYECVVTPAS